MAYLFDIYLTKILLRLICNPKMQSDKKKKEVS